MARSKNDQPGKRSDAVILKQAASMHEETWQAASSDKKQSQLLSYESQQTGSRIDPALALKGLPAVRSLDFP